MHLGSPFILPLSNPTLIFSVVLLVILFSPLLLSRLRVPPLVGLVLAGMCLGPFGFNVLSNDDSFRLFGNVGLLYILFVAGISFDLNDIPKNRLKGGVFAALSFLGAMVLGVFTGIYFLNLSFLTSALLASMYASHTLVAYPIVNRFGLSGRRSVKIAVVGSLITVTLSLIVLTLVADRFSTSHTDVSWLQAALRMVIFAVIVLWVFPKIAHSFFKRFEDSVLQYIFVLSLVFFGAFFAQVAGLQGVVGAFMVGVALNRLVPKISPLMNRLEFVGSALFIPFFLISMGMAINFRAITHGFDALLAALVMVSVAICTKWVAAWLTQKTFSMRRNERLMLFGLSNGQAGATLVSMMIGYSIVLPDGTHLLPDSIMVGAVIMILILGTLSNFMTEKASRDMLSSKRSADDITSEIKKRERILFTVANPNTLDQLVELALALKTPKNKEDLYALNVITDADEAKKAQGELLLQQAAKVASVADQWVERITRYDVNVASGILYSAKEYAISDVVIGLHQKVKMRDSLYGLMTEMLLKGVSCSLYIYKSTQPLQLCKRLIVILPAKAELEVGFGRSFEHVCHIARKQSAHLVVYAIHDTRNALTHLKRMHQGVSIEFVLYYEVNEIDFSPNVIMDDDLQVFFAARPTAISYHVDFETLITKTAQSTSQGNLLVVFPEQYEKQENSGERFSTLNQPHYKFERLRRSEKWMLIQLKREWNRVAKHLHKK